MHVLTYIHTVQVSTYAYVNDPFVIRQWERGTHHGLFIDGVQADDGHVEVDNGGIAAVLRGLVLVVQLHIERKDVRYSKTVRRFHPEIRQCNGNVIYEVGDITELSLSTLYPIVRRCPCNTVAD